MENESNKGVIWLVVALLLVGGGIYLMGDKEPVAQTEPQDQEPFHSAEMVDYENKDLGFAMKVPKGYLVDERPKGVLVVAQPTEEEPEPSPELQIQVTEGNLQDFKMGEGITLLTDEEVVINGMKGRKFVITADSLPKGTECEFYSFEDRGVVYELSEYNCQDSEIFETVLNTFEWIWEK